MVYEVVEQGLIGVIALLWAEPVRVADSPACGKTRQLAAAGAVVVP